MSYILNCIAWEPKNSKYAQKKKKKDWKKYTRLLTVVTSGLWDYGLHFVSSLSFLNIDYDKYLLSIMCRVLNDGVKAKRWLSFYSVGSSTDHFLYFL